MARRMALFASRFLSGSSSECLRGTALTSNSTRTPAIEHGISLRTYAAKAAKSLSASKDMSADTVNNITAKSKEKRPRSAYALFRSETGPQILANHQGLSLGEGSKIVAAEWKKVSQEEKDRLQARVVLDTPSVPAKMPRSAYQLWMKQSGPEILKKLGGTFANVGERSKLLSVEWKKVSEEERSRLKAELEKIKPARETPARGRPAKKGGAPSAYNHYVKQNFPSHKKDGMATTAVMKELAATWNTLSAAEKEEYASKTAKTA